MRGAEQAERTGQIKNAHRIVKKPEGKRPWKTRDNIRMDLIEMRWENVDEIHVAQDRGQWRALVNTVMNLRVS